MIPTRFAVVVLGLTSAVRPVVAQTPASAPSPSTAPTSLPLYTYPGFNFYVRLDTVGVAATVAASRAAAFHALRSVYAELQVPLTLEDSVAGWLGTLRLIRSQSLGRMQLSRVIDCGSGMTGPVADNARVQIALVTFVRSAGTDSASVRTALVASAQSVGGEQSDHVRCGSTGHLENWIRSHLLERIGQH